MAATLSAGSSHASHRAAACLHGLDGFAEPQPIEVTVARGRCPVRDDIVVHRWTGPEANDYMQVDSIATSGIATTLACLGAVVPALQVEQALDDALRRGHSLRWIRETAERLHRPGPTGTGVLLKLLRDPARQQAVPDSVFERITARLLSEAGLPTPALQHPVRLHNGRIVRIDIAWPEVRWGIECHSRRYTSVRPARQPTTTATTCWPPLAGRSPTSPGTRCRTPTTSSSSLETCWRCGRRRCPPNPELAAKSTPSVQNTANSWRWSPTAPTARPAIQNWQQKARYPCKTLPIPEGGSTLRRLS